MQDRFADGSAGPVGGVLATARSNENVCGKSHSLCGSITAVSGRAEQLRKCRSSQTRRPRIWTDSALKDWANTVVGVNARPNFYSEAEYYAAPLDNVRTYPVYHPDREPAAYLEYLKKPGREPMVEIGKPRTKAGWIETGRRVWDELDIVHVRTSDFRVPE